MSHYPRHATSDRLSRGICFAIIVAGCLVLTGWAFSINALKALGPALPRMSVSTAVCFLLVGVSILSANAWGGRARILAWLAVLIVFTVALLRFSQHVFKWDAGLERLVWSWFTSSPMPPLGRMAGNTAMAFLLTSLSLLLIQADPQKKYPLTVALLAITIVSQGMAVLISYVAGFSSTIGAPSMAVHTASLFVMIGVALLVEAWRQSGQTWFLSKGLTKAFVATGVVCWRIDRTRLVRRDALAVESRDHRAQVR